MNNYNLKKLEIETILKCFKEYPEKTVAEVAQLLGIDEKALQKKIEECGGNIEELSAIARIAKAIRLLESNGYTITKTSPITLRTLKDSFIAYRIANSITQTKFATAFDISQSIVSVVENGNVENISPFMAKKLFQVYDKIK